MITTAQARFRSDAHDTAIGERDEAILVLDQVRSTERMIDLGDLAACQENTQLLRLLSMVATRYGGRVLNYTGDGAILRFLDPDVAVAAAASAMSGCEGVGHPAATTPVCLRAGLHVGRLASGSVHAFGVALVAAVRLCDQAAPGELLVSGGALDRCRHPIAVGSQLSLCLKGVAAQMEVHSAPGDSLARRPSVPVGS